MKKPNILVVGSFVMDLIVSTNVFPNSGETVLGYDFKTAPGGKGANQAVQAARLGSKVSMVGKVGDDSFGKELLASMEKADICTDKVAINKDVASAVGNIVLEPDEKGSMKNRIIVVPGANMTITQADIEFLKEDIAKFDIVLLQFEIPMEINEKIVEYAKEKNVPVMLNCAPAAPISKNIMQGLSYICPNEHEAFQITGMKIKKENNEVNLNDVKAVGEQLIKQGAQNAVITLGEHGAAIISKDEFIYNPGIKLDNVVDPTAAGDSFIGAFATGICTGLSKEEAMTFAHHTASITVSNMGAQPSLPKLESVIKTLGNNTINIEKLEALRG